jgi:hypothetical protein
MPMRDPPSRSGTVSQGRGRVKKKSCCEATVTIQPSEALRDWVAIHYYPDGSLKEGHFAVVRGFIGVLAQLDLFLQCDR